MPDMGFEGIMDCFITLLYDQLVCFQKITIFDARLSILL